MMRHLYGTVAAAVLVSGVAALGSAPAFAGPDEASQDSFWSHQSVAQPGSSANGHYMKMDPRDAQVSSSATSADEGNPYFNHAMGTMNGPKEVAQSQSATKADNGRYTATYNQYLPVNPADTKPAAGSNASADDPYFYHAMGTMSRP